MRTLAALLVALFTLSACEDGPPEYLQRSTRAVFDPSGNDYWSVPFPSDLRLEDDGSYDFERFPMYDANSPRATSVDLIGIWLETANERVRDGFGVSSGVFQPMSGAIDPASLPTPESSMSAEASVFLIDIDPNSAERGRFFPLDVKFFADGDRYAPPNLLAAVPLFGFVRRPKTSYALVITDALQDTSGEAVGRSRPFHDAFEGAEGSNADARASFEPLHETLELLGVDGSRVVSAAVFRTFDHNKLILELAEWAESLPLPSLEDFVVAEEHESYQILTSTFTVPVFQTGERPYDKVGEGRLLYGADGKPQIREMQGVRLALAIPKSPQPATGFPLTMYLHGSGGEWYQPFDRGPRPEDGSPLTQSPIGRGPAEWLARRGIATAGFDFPLHGNRHDPPDTSGLVFYNLFGNVSATIDNFHVAMVELMLLSRLLTELDIDAQLAPTLDAGAATDGKIRFDPERLTGMGQSMGTTLAVPWATVDPRVKGLVLSGAGGILVEIAVTALEPLALKGFLEPLIELPDDQEIHIHHPLLHAFQNVWDLVDPIAKAPYVADRPHPGVPPKHIMMTAGVRDGYFHPRSQTAMAVALGTTLVGEEVEPILPDALRIDGRDTISYPMRASSESTLNGVVQYAAPNNLGHYVVFNQDGARYQFTCFVKSVGDAEGPIIPAAAGLDDPCP